MDGSLIIGLTLTFCAVGYYLNHAYTEKYGEAAIQWEPFALQFICVSGALLTFSEIKISGWFILWSIGCVVSYAIGLSTCREHAIKQNAEQNDIMYAMIAQALLPLGSALLLIIIIAMFFINTNNKKRKKKR